MVSKSKYCSVHKYLIIASNGLNFKKHSLVGSDIFCRK